MLRYKKQKIFVIGRNKTGTTSIGEALKSLGFKLGKQNIAERLLNDWAKRDFRRIIKYCKNADAFQDIPFSLNYTYIIIDHAFPHSKFILTVRDTAQEWYNSLIRFHTKAIGKERIPTAEDLKQHPYIYKGWLWESQKYGYGINEESLYDKDIYIKHYEEHNKDVLRYFRNRDNDLLVFNIAHEDSMTRLCNFLNIKNEKITMPHLNRT